MSLLNLFRRRRHQREMTDEMRFHIDMEAAELERTGLAPAEARRRALASFGGVRHYQEQGHEARGGAWLENLLRDLRYAGRSIRRSPGYAAIVILTLALGIAANTSIVSVANGILFKPLAYRDPSRLMLIWDDLDWVGVPEAWVTGQEFNRLRRATTRFEGFAAFRAFGGVIGGSGGVEPLQVQQSLVTANFFQLLGVGPEIGRGFAPGEDALGSPRLAVISRRLFTQRFGADRSLLGREIIVDDVPATLIGVLPASFRFSAENSLGAATDNIDVYLPLTDTLDRVPPGAHMLGVLARVRPDAVPDEALAELEALSEVQDREHYRDNGFRFLPIQFKERMVREVRPALFALLAAVGTLLAIMSANLAMLALARTGRRERELAVRRAIGASHGRVGRQILLETGLLSIAGAAAGSALGALALRALLAAAPPGLPRRAEIGIDLAVVAITLGVALLIAVGMGLAPLFHSLRADLSAVLREKAPSHPRGRARRGLVLAQFALSMVLLAGTGLLLGSFVRLASVDPGFDGDNVLTVELQLSPTRYPGGQPVVDAFARYIDALRTLPGVVAAGATGAPPLSARASQSGARFPSSPANRGEGGADVMLVDLAPVTEDYFRAMGIAMLEGRSFDVSHRDPLSLPVVVIDDILAARYFPAGNAVGQTARIDGDPYQVIGIVRHVRMYDLREEGRPQVWFPHGQGPERNMVIAVRARKDPLALVGPIRDAIRAIDPNQVIVAMRPMTQAVAESLAERRLVLLLVGSFAGAALFLAALGIYGIASSAVTERTRELGIRMAMGADRRAVVRSVLAGPAKLAALGLLIGLGGTLAMGRVVRGLLYGVNPTDPLTLGGVAVVFLAATFVATYLPARRATKVDPTIALRSD